MKAYGYAWITLGFFLISLVGYFLFGYSAGKTTAELIAGFFENTQSEFLQLLWQVVGLAFLLYVGSPQSKEASDRVEAKLDTILRSVDPSAEHAIDAIDARYRRYAGADSDLSR